MKGFIEVTETLYGEIVFINIQHIQAVQRSIITVDGTLFKAKETYEEIKELIKKAMK